jgi:hypothetical protein
MKKCKVLIAIGCGLIVSACGGGGGGTTPTTSISVGNTAPVADAGAAQRFVVGTQVSLDGSASSDFERDPLTYAWTLVSKPPGSLAKLSDGAISKPSLTVDVPGTYSASLVVNDGKANSAPAQTTVVVGSVPFDALQGSWDAAINGSTDKLTVSISGNTLTIKVTRFLEPTCLYTAPLTAARDGIGAGTYNCSDFASGTWQLLDMQKNDQADIYIQLNKGAALQRIYGMNPTGLNVARPLPAAIATLAGMYRGIATGGPFGTDSVRDLQLSVSGTKLDISIPRFFSGTCQYSATIQADGKSVVGATYRCSDFSTGTWSLNDLRTLDGGDLYLSLTVGSDVRRVYGVK